MFQKGDMKQVAYWGPKHKVPL